MPNKKRKFSSRFPPARIKKIMQTDEDVGKVAVAVPVIISRALELFIESLILKSADATKSKNAKTLSASHIKQIITSEKKFDFLKDLVSNIPDAAPGEEGGEIAGVAVPERKPVKQSARKPVVAKPAAASAPGKRPRGRPRKIKPEELASPKPVKRTKTDETSDEDEDTETESAEEETDTDEESSGLKLQVQPTTQASSSYTQHSDVKPTTQDSMPYTQHSGVKPTTQDSMPYTQHSGVKPTTQDSMPYTQHSGVKPTTHSSTSDTHHSGAQLPSHGNDVANSKPSASNEECGEVTMQPASHGGSHSHMICADTLNQQSNLPVQEQLNNGQHELSHQVTDAVSFSQRKKEERLLSQVFDPNTAELHTAPIVDNKNLIDPNLRQPIKSQAECDIKTEIKYEDKKSAIEPVPDLGSHLPTPSLEGYGYYRGATNSSLDDTKPVLGAEIPKPIHMPKTEAELKIKDTNIIFDKTNTMDALRDKAVINPFMAESDGKALVQPDKDHGSSGQSSSVKAMLSYKLKHRHLPDPVTSHGEVPIPVTSHGEVPIPVTSHEEVPIPVTSHEEVPIPVTSHGLIPIPVTSHGQVPIPVTSHSQVPTHMTSHVPFPVTSHDSSVASHRDSVQYATDSKHPSERAIYESYRQAYTNARQVREQSPQSDLRVPDATVAAPRSYLNSQVSGLPSPNSLPGHANVQLPLRSAQFLAPNSRPPIADPRLPTFNLPAPPALVPSSSMDKPSHTTAPISGVNEQLAPKQANESHKLRPSYDLPPPLMQSSALSPHFNQSELSHLSATAPRGEAPTARPPGQRAAPPPLRPTSGPEAPRQPSVPLHLGHSRAPPPLLHSSAPGVPRLQHSHPPSHSSVSHSISTFLTPPSALQSRDKGPVNGPRDARNAQVPSEETALDLTSTKRADEKVFRNVNERHRNTALAPENKRHKQEAYPSGYDPRKQDMHSNVHELAKYGSQSVAYDTRKLGHDLSNRQIPHSNSEHLQKYTPHVSNDESRQFKPPAEGDNKPQHPHHVIKSKATVDRKVLSEKSTSSSSEQSDNRESKAEKLMSAEYPPGMGLAPGVSPAQMAAFAQQMQAMAAYNPHMYGAMGFPPGIPQYPGMPMPGYPVMHPHMAMMPGAYGAGAGYWPFPGMPMPPYTQPQSNGALPNNSHSLPTDRHKKS